MRFIFPTHHFSEKAAIKQIFARAGFFNQAFLASVHSISNFCAEMTGERHFVHNLVLIIDQTVQLWKIPLFDVLAQFFSFR